jgi:hypothetical protein
MSGRLTFICVLEANPALSCVPSARLARCGSLSKSGSRGGGSVWIADAHCDDGKRFVVHANEKLTAFLELEKATRKSLRFSNAE